LSQKNAIFGRKLFHNYKVGPRFTFYPQLGLCELLGSCSGIDVDLCSDCITGEQGSILQNSISDGNF
jgi:hypothetical protein